MKMEINFNFNIFLSRIMNISLKNIKKPDNSSVNLNYCFIVLRFGSGLDLAQS